ncbi:MAG TPA: hypothetical protein ENJ82_11705, partial [Bacteroidetes bacterium]|nr:hypothetical protein [Bacteroidota bacterium]
MELIEDLKAIHGHLEPKWARFSSQISDGFGNEKSFSDLETFAEFRFNIFDQWFGEPEKESKLNREFMGFGQMGEGSVAAIWLLEGSDLETSPVVLIGSEGEVGVIAPDYLTFMLLIGQGFGMYEMLEGKHNAGC